MTNTLNTHVQQSYSHLVANVATGTRDLIAAHAEQMGHEVKAEADRATSVVGYFSAAGTLMGIAFVCGIVAITQLLQERYCFSGTASWGITGLITFLCGVIMMGIARHQLTTVQWIPKQSLHSLQESLLWATRKH
ncbi:hypothetical protein BH11PLA2_BH11PLA2_45010 [soil metagenome]